MGGLTHYHRIPREHETQPRRRDGYGEHEFTYPSGSAAGAEGEAGHCFFTAS